MIPSPAPRVPRINHHHPAEWVVLGMAAMGMLWALGALITTDPPVPECAVPVPTTTIHGEQRT